MEYAQLNETGTEAIQITTHGNVEWDGNNFCSAEALVKDGKSEQFNVVPLLVVAMPEYDSATHKCFRDGCEQVDGDWQYKWTIEALTEEEIFRNERANVPQEITKAQFILALLEIGLLDEVEAAIAQTDRAIQINYKERGTVRRDNPLVNYMGDVLNKTSAEIDAVFKLGVTL